MDKIDRTCTSCEEQLVEPYIECCQCDAISLCTTCFACGRELGSHKNYHNYSVRKNNFPLFENCNWTAKEEYKLLSAMTTYGYGNWEEVCKVLQSRSKIECQEHYKKYYIDQVQHEELSLLPPTEQSVFSHPIIPFLYSYKGSEDPPRSISNQHLAGYNAYRSDFELSYDSTAESIFNMNTYTEDGEDDDALMQELKLSLFRALNTRLNERQRRYQIIQRHGLILLRKLKSWLQRYDKTVGRPTIERLLPFVQLTDGDEFNKFLETLSFEKEKFQRVVRLCEYRRFGIKSLYGAKVFEDMRVRHEQQLREQKYYTLAISHKFDQRFARNNMKTQRLGKMSKKPVIPLNIIDLPDYNVLTDREKDLCSRLRLIPRVYLDIKDQFIIENNKMGNLKLLEARRIAKIDVNKTRKIFDFLAIEGFITTPIN